MNHNLHFGLTEAFAPLKASVRKTPALRKLFEQNPKRAQQFLIQRPGMLLDFSKTHLTGTLLEWADRLAEELEFDGQIHALFEGQKVNTTENRPALHTALRAAEDQTVTVDGRDIMADIRRVKKRMREISGLVQDKRWKGVTGKSIRYIVNIGIGGSFLGPLTVTTALSDMRQLPVAFLSNVDDEHLARVQALFPPEETLYVVVSKSFGTPETLTNAGHIKDRLIDRFGPQAVSQHFLAVTAHPDKARQWGIPEANILPMWDFVGGRYSLWSAAGISIALSLGYEVFERLLEGARAADNDLLRHRRTQDNPARLTAFLTLLYQNLYGYDSEVYLPYRQRLQFLPFYLQQLIMESNGKSVQRNGLPVEYTTAPVIWGDTGTNAQHSFFQALHQGTVRTLPYFIADIQSPTPYADNRRFLLANLLAQTESLAFGREADSPFDRFEGNRPSVTWLFDRLDAYGLGYLLATFEHKTYLESLYWNINAFDQPGVELGKILARRYDGVLRRPPSDSDSPAVAFIKRHRADET